MLRRSPRAGTGSPGPGSSDLPTPPHRLGVPPGADPHDTCVRCGRPTPVGEALCEYDNPGRISGPSPTQVHGTVLVAVLLFGIVLAFAARASISGVGPFASSLAQRTARPDGSIGLVISVTNQGSRQGAATCRVTRAGAPTPNDLVFFTELLAPGATRTFERELRNDPTAEAISLDRLAVRCT